MEVRVCIVFNRWSNLWRFLIGITGIQTYSRAMNILLSSCGIAIIYINSIILLETIIKRIKAQMFWKTTLIYSICRGIKKQ